MHQSILKIHLYRAATFPIDKVVNMYPFHKLEDIVAFTQDHVDEQEIFTLDP